MSILFGGGEMGAFVPSDSTVIENTASGRFNSSFARCAIYCDNSLSYAESEVFTATANFWLHVEISQNGAFNTDATFQKLIEFLDSSGTARVRLLSDSPVVAGGNFKLETWNGSAWLAAGSFSTSVNSLQTIDINIVSNTASGSVALYLSGTERIAPGTIDLSAFSGIAQVRMYGKTSGIGVPVYYSQIIGADESTIGWRLTTVPATSAGATTDWVGTYAEIDEIAYSDADFLNSATANQVELVAHSTAIPAGYRVRAAVVTARGRRGSASGPQHVELALRSGGTTYFSASKSLALGYKAFTNAWETDPATSAAFTTTAAGLIQFGVKSIA
jgi:hypothetical protein